MAKMAPPTAAARMIRPRTLGPVTAPIVRVIRFRDGGVGACIGSAGGDSAPTRPSCACERSLYGGQYASPSSLKPCRARWQTSQVKPRLWASLAPFGIGRTKPHHYLEIARTVWENRRDLPYAWRILSRGVCDGCALGVAGFHDWTMDGIHLCTTRLDLLRLNTARALDPAVLADVAAPPRSSAALRALGRLPYPMHRRRGESGFRRVSWDEALALAAARIPASAPGRIGF